MVKSSYKGQRHRGTEGFGFYSPDEDRLTHNVGETQILRLLRKYKSAEIMFHHRYPTSTKNVRNACHPFSTKDRFENQYIGMHNGVVYNDLEVGLKQLENGIKYVSMQDDGSYNDSEVLVYDIAEYLEGLKDEIECYGNIAFIIIKRNKHGEKEALYYGHNSGSPLILNKKNGAFSLTSEGQGKKVKTQTLFRYDYETGETTESPMKIDVSKYYGSNYGARQVSLSEEIDDGEYNLRSERILDMYADWGRYSVDAPKTEARIVGELKEALRYDSFFCGDDAAVYMAEELLREMGERYSEIEEMFENGIDTSDTDVSEFIDLENRAYLLNRAKKAIEEEQLKLAIGSLSSREKAY